MKQNLKRDMARNPTLAQRTRKDGAPGGGAQVSGTTLLDAAHADGVSRDRSHREQPARGPCKRRRKKRALENKNTFSTFAPARRLRRDVRIEESWSMFRPYRWLVGRASTGR